MYKMTRITLAGGIVATADERGISGCPCPIGKADMGAGCIVSQDGLRTPVCVVKMTTPKVRLTEYEPHLARRLEPQWIFHVTTHGDICCRGMPAGSMHNLYYIYMV